MIILCSQESRESLTPPVLQMRAAHRLPSEEYSMERNKTNNFLLTNLTNSSSAWWSRFTSTVLTHVDPMYCWYDVMRIAPCFYGFPFQNSQFQHKKNIWFPVEGHSTKHQISITSKLSRFIKTKENLIKCHSDKETKEWLWLDVESSRWTPGKEKRQKVKTKEI